MRGEDVYPHTFCQEESTTVLDNNRPPGGDQVAFTTYYSCHQTFDIFQEDIRHK